MATALLSAFQKIQSVSEKIEKVQKNIFVKATQSFFLVLLKQLIKESMRNKDWFL